MDGNTDRDYYSKVIDYRSFVEEQAGGFWGRAQLFGELSTWLAAEGPRFFSVIGGPGSGKTAIAARLAQFSMGDATAVQDMPNLQKGFLSAFHFCSTSDLRGTGDRRWFHPHVFAESLSTQLAARYVEFGKALIEKSSNRQITITMEQRIDTLTGQAIGIIIKNLDVSRLTPEDAFSYVVREPLEELAKQRPNERFVLLIDALDESLRYSGRVNILRLLTDTNRLTPQVRFIVSARPGLEALGSLADASPSQVQSYRLDQEPGLAHSQQDIFGYVIERAVQLGVDKRLARGLTSAQLATAVQERSGGNFLYVEQLLQMLATSRGTINHAALDGLPDGLFRFYRSFLNRVLEPTNRSWEERYQPALGTLAVEREALNREQIGDIVKTGKGKVAPVLTSVRQLLDEDEKLPASRRTYAFFHRSMAEFLLSEDAAEEYWCEEAEQHERVAEHYLVQSTEESSDSRDLYGLRNLAFHLAEAALGRKQPARHQHVQTLVNLLCSPDFERHYQTTLDDPISWREDLLRALRVAAVDTHAQAPILLIRLATAYLAFRQKYLQPEALFALVRQGELRTAERRLDLFAIDSKWRQAALLAISWVAAAQPALHDAAESLYRRIGDEAVHPEPIPLLMERVHSTLSGTSEPAVSVHAAPPEEVARAFVARMGGMTAFSAMPNVTEQLQSYTGEPLYVQSELLNAALEGGEGNESIFAAAQEAPLLVAYADEQAARLVEVDTEHDFIGAYIRIHAANNYIRYRNGSLWVILDAVLHHRDPTWVCDRVVELVTTSLASNKLEYLQNLPLALLARQAKADVPDGASKLEEVLGRARMAVESLEPIRGKNDTIGSVTRWLAGLAEVQSFILQRPEVARELIQKALSPELYGFAGLYAPAALTLAEAIRISLPFEQDLGRAALDKAVQSAHRIQDARFCAQTTARWNALSERWWNSAMTASELETTIQAFATDPSGARFGALHRRGESYNNRPKEDSGQFPIPALVLEARTLAELASVYERPLAEFERMNPEDDGSKEWINVPDPEFAPLLAARLAAEALVVDGLANTKRVALIQLLIPTAVSNPTALDTILARLVLAARPQKPNTLEELTTAVDGYRQDDVDARPAIVMGATVGSNP